MTKGKGLITNAFNYQADIAKVQEWLGHVNIATTRIYDRRKTRPEESSTFKRNFLLIITSNH
jgi:integrase/recombinase XerD